ncbi:MAG: LacI family DNA-binding transcriptional regulator [Anaerolineae bacterium]|nr:LacI family DNA-binding transcriptional regulator [Anaerolineae bacterium]
MPKVTISDIARRAGVSKTAVSFAFNDSSRLPEDTVQRILSVAEELGYIPNPIARSLSSNRTGNLGLLFPQPLPHVMRNPYNAELLQGVGQACERSGYNVLLVSPVLGSIRQAVSGAVVDGFLTIGLEHYRPTIKLLDQRAVPYVMVDSEPFPGVACVNIDDTAGAYQAMHHVLERKHRRIAILGIASGKRGRYKSYVGTLQGRIAGYQAALAEIGLAIDDENVRLFECACTHEGGRRGFDRCWRAMQPTAIITMADVLAAGALEAASAASIPVPQRVSIVGFDDLPFTRLTNPPLTTIHQPIHNKGEFAANLLFDILNNGAELTQYVFPTHLVERETVAAV